MLNVYRSWLLLETNRKALWPSKSSIRFDLEVTFQGRQLPRWRQVAILDFQNQCSIAFYMSTCSSIPNLNALAQTVPDLTSRWPLKFGASKMAAGGHLEFSKPCVRVAFCTSTCTSIPNLNALAQTIPEKFNIGQSKMVTNRRPWKVSSRSNLIDDLDGAYVTSD
jgi:hypothetical protein